MRNVHVTLAFAGSLALSAVLAACGSTPNAEVPPAPSASAPKPPPPPPASTTAAPPPATTTAAPPASTTPPAPPPAKMPEVKASTMGEDLKGIGLDIDKLPKMSKLTAAQRAKVMPFLKKATGFDCKDCHEGEKDFKKKTALKEVSEKMWDEYVVPNKLASGPLFCDSCHQGSHGYLPRKDAEAVKAYMDKEISKKVVKKDGKEVACATCHTDMFEANIFEKVWKIKGAPHQ